MNNPSRFPSGKVIIDKGIPMVHHHTPREVGEVPGMLAWAGPSFVDYAQKAGKAVAEKVECEGAIALSQSGLSEGENRVIENFKIGYSEVCSNPKFLDVTVIGVADMPKSIVVSGGTLQAYPDITAAFSSTATGAQAWALAAQEGGIEKGKIAIVGMDGLRVNLDLVASGDVWMIVGQPVFEEAYYNVVLLVTHLMGYPVPFENILPAPQITLENVDEFYAIVDKAEAVEIK
jgi:ABC-type sugar transport system substrate-binding protein